MNEIDAHPFENETNQPISKLLIHKYKIIFVYVLKYPFIYLVKYLEHDTNDKTMQRERDRSRHVEAGF